MDALKEFLTREIASIGSFSFKIWMIIAIAVIIVLAVIAVVCAIRNSNEKKQRAANDAIIASMKESRRAEKAEAARQAEEAERAKQAEEAAKAERAKQAEVEKEEPKSESAPVKKDAPAPANKAAVEEEPNKPAPVETEPAVKEPPVEEPVEEQPAEPVVEETPAEEKAEPVAEQPVAEQPVEESVKEEQDAEVAATVAPAKKTKKTAAKKPAAQENNTNQQEEDMADKKKPAKTEKPATEVVGKFVICNAPDGFRFTLCANNGQLLYESRDYKSFDSCKSGVETFRAAVANADFKVRADKFNNYKFYLKSPTSTTMIYVGESYKTKAASLNNVESIKRFAAVSPVVDATDDNYVAELIEFEIPAETKKAVETGKGAVGKWEIARLEEEDPKSGFVYLLYANNGQLLYESREYKTAANCKSGMETFVATVRDGTFKIDQDKFGHYKFVLRSAKSQMEYTGPSYDTKQASMANVNSVYKFALLTPIE